MDAFLLNFCFHLMEDRIPNSKSGLYPILSDIHCPVVINFDTSVTVEPDNTLFNDVNVVHVDNDHDVIYKSNWKNNNANVFVENLKDENVHYLDEKLEI